MGHLVVDAKSDYIGKGSIKGSFESLASGYGIAEAAKRKIQNRKENSEIFEIINGDLTKITAKIVIDCARNEDSLALEIFDEAMGYWGIGLDTMIKLFNPEAIVIAGGLIKSGDIFIESLKRNILKHKLADVENNVPILSSSFGSDATLIGAKSLVIRKILHFEP